MPTYTYRCDHCDTAVDVTRAIEMRDAELLCATCSDPCRREFGVGAVTFRGTGFYRTDRSS